VRPPCRKNLGAPGPLRGEKLGSDFFLSHPLPQNPLDRSRDFAGFEVVWGCPKNPENLRKIDFVDFEIFRKTYVIPVPTYVAGRKNTRQESVA